MRNLYAKQLLELKSKMVEMGQMCGEILAIATRAALSGDVSLESETAPILVEIDKSEKDVESLCLQLILRQQPVASDLRQISSCLKMITDMERIGNESDDICEIVRFLGGRSVKECKSIEPLIEITSQMVKESTDAFVSRDTALAARVVSEDDKADGFYSDTRKELIEIIAANKADGEFALDVLIIAKHLERIADHAVNIAEWVRFAN